MPVFLWTQPYVPFPFADFNLYPLTVINLNWNITVTFLSSVSLSSKSLNMSVVLETEKKMHNLKVETCVLFSGQN